jgi:uncharacterized protein YbjT (DUF2867 family)
MSLKKVVAVVGATGVQGGSVANALLADGTFTVRALTRNPESEQAKNLQAKGAEVVQFDSNQRDLVREDYMMVYEPIPHS